MPRIRKIKKPRPITEKTRQEDERLREELRKADMGLFEDAMEKMMKPQPVVPVKRKSD